MPMRTGRSNLGRTNRILTIIPNWLSTRHRFYSTRRLLTLDDILPSSQPPDRRPAPINQAPQNPSGSNVIQPTSRNLDYRSQNPRGPTSFQTHFNRTSALELTSDPIRRRSGERTHYSLIVRSTPNNTRLTLTHTPISYLPGSTPGHPAFKAAYPMAGSIVARATAGSVGFKSGRRQEFEAATQATLSMFGKIRELIHLNPLTRLNSSPSKREGIPRELEIVFDGFGVGRDAFIASLLNSQATDLREIVRSIRDTTIVKIGGPRPKKRRRV